MEKQTSSSFPPSFADNRLRALGLRDVVFVLFCLSISHLLVSFPIFFFILLSSRTFYFLNIHHSRTSILVTLKAKSVVLPLFFMCLCALKSACLFIGLICMFLLASSLGRTIDESLCYDDGASVAFLFRSELRPIRRQMIISLPGLTRWTDSVLRKKEKEKGRVHRSISFSVQKEKKKNLLLVALLLLFLLSLPPSLISFLIFFSITLTFILLKYIMHVHVTGPLRLWLIAAQLPMAAHQFYSNQKSFNRASLISLGFSQGFLARRRWWVVIIYHPPPRLTSFLALRTSKDFPSSFLTAFLLAFPRFALSDVCPLIVVRKRTMNKK